MKLSGQVAVRFRKPTDSAPDTVLTRYLPAAQVAGSVSAAEGLSGGSYKIQVGNQFFVARKQPECGLPGLSLRRHYRTLKRLSDGTAPEPLCLAEGWLITSWVDGEVKTKLPPLPELSALLYDLHRQPLFGWRLNLPPLLEFYWQASSPQRRTWAWLRELKRLRRNQVPRPLRLAPLHMDVHAGNIVHRGSGLSLIDWEYAGDGDIALELAVICVANQIDVGALVENYAGWIKLKPHQLKRQVMRWRPWAALLMASWYECRWQQTRQQHFITLADDAWRTLRAINNQER